MYRGGISPCFNVSDSIALGVLLTYGDPVTLLYPMRVGEASF
jgi:hypothetical protein